MFDDHPPDPPSRTRTLAVLVAAAAALALAVPALAAAAAGGATVGPAVVAAQSDGGEEPYEVPVPNEGDEYFEAADPDGEWVSYVNPRDEYRDPYLGDGSGKLCVTLLNADGEVIAGETVPDTVVEIPTGETIEWHSGADPMTVQFPLTDHYERPLDSDQFGTSPEYAQGDGLLDAHCIEFHGPRETDEIEYGQVEIEGEHADDIEVVGYVQQANEAWDTDVDPIADAESYADAGGGWTYEPNGSHGQAVAVLQLTGDGSSDGADGSDDGTGTSKSNDAGGEVDDGDGESGGLLADSTPGAGVVAGLFAVAAVLLAAVGRVRRG